jgi:predicted transcriptional regulator
MHQYAFIIDLGQTLATLMQDWNMSQKDVALAAGVSQASVSRFLRHRSQRSGQAYRRLCTYIREADASRVKEIPHVGEALRRTWDGTDQHAAALAELIDASAKLWPEAKLWPS